jgi:predicted glycogen debranching enzyme
VTRTAVPLPPLLGIPLRRLHELDEATRLEWVEADGRGGYAAGTAAGANTRRAHGLVVASVPPAERLVLLARVEETVVLDDGARFDLGVAFYPDAVHPTGYTLLQSFALDPWPMWRWRVGDVEIVKELFVARRTGATVLRYQVRGADVLLELRPLFAGRATGAIRTANEEVRTEAEASERLVAYQAYDDVPAVMLSFATGRWEARQDWYYRAVYPRDAAADEAREDLFCPGVLRMPLDGETPSVLACGLRPARVAFAASWVSDELLRRGRIADAGRAATHDDERLSELGARLGLAADAFLIERAGGRSIVAGYPEPAERTTAALIALPGLCLATGRPEAAAAVLRTIALAMREGMLPDALDRPFDAGTAMPETSLWFVEAVARLHEAQGDARPFLAALHATLARLERGWPGVRLAPDGLLERTVGAATAPLDGTGEPVQPGKDVALNALWYNALIRAASLDAGDARATGYRAAAERCKRAFESFWFADGAYLHDRIGPNGERAAALRAGQLLAVALPHSMIDAARARKVVDIVDRELVVPLGVRARAPREPARAAGGERAADRGASAEAWPWLLAHFARAYLRVHGDDPHTRERLRRIAFEFASHLDDAGLGHVAERFGAEPPYRPAGRLASAMSCGAVLEMLALTTTASE